MKAVKPEVGIETRAPKGHITILTIGVRGRDAEKEMDQVGGREQVLPAEL